jgi:hypothetical protein
MRKPRPLAITKQLIPVTAEVQRKMPTRMERPCGSTVASSGPSPTEHVGPTQMLVRPFAVKFAVWRGSNVWQ